MQQKFYFFVSPNEILSVKSFGLALLDMTASLCAIVCLRLCNADQLVQDWSIMPGCRNREKKTDISHVPTCPILYTTSLSVTLKFNSKTLTLQTANQTQIACVIGLNLNH